MNVPQCKYINDCSLKETGNFLFCHSFPKTLALITTLGFFQEQTIRATFSFTIQNVEPIQPSFLL